MKLFLLSPMELFPSLFLLHRNKQVTSCRVLLLEWQQSGHCSPISDGCVLFSFCNVQYDHKARGRLQKEQPQFICCCWKTSLQAAVASCRKERTRLGSKEVKKHSPSLSCPWNPTVLLTDQEPQTLPWIWHWAYPGGRVCKTCHKDVASLNGFHSNLSSKCPGCSACTV